MVYHTLGHFILEVAGCLIFKFVWYYDCMGYLLVYFLLESADTGTGSAHDFVVASPTSHVPWTCHVRAALAS